MWSLCTQQAGLSTIEWGQIPPGVGAIVSPQAAATWGEWSAWAGWLLPCGAWLSTRIPEATLSVLSPRLLSPVSSQVSLIHFAPQPLPGIYWLWISPAVVNLLISTQQSGLSTTGPEQRPSWAQGYCFPSGCCCSEGNSLPEHSVCCHMEDDSASTLQSRSWCPLSQFSPQSFSPQSLLRHHQPTLLTPFPELRVRGFK